METPRYCGERSVLTGAARAVAFSGKPVRQPASGLRPDCEPAPRYAFTTGISSHRVVYLGERRSCLVDQLRTSWPLLAMDEFPR